MIDVFRKILDWFLDVLRRPFAWLVGIFTIVLNLCYSLFDWISGMIYDVAIDSMPSLSGHFDTELFSYFIKLFQLRDLFTRSTAYVTLCLACYATHFIGIPISYSLKLLRLR